jgi:hypothetical protein
VIELGFAIINEKDAHRRATIRSTSPLTTELEKQAKALDKYLKKRIPEIEKELVAEGLLTEVVEGNDLKQDKGSVLLWHALGTKLRAICQSEGITGRRERRWLWEAVENIYSTQRIRRATRGHTRIHFEYCYRLAGFKLEFAKQVNWSEWVYFFDSRTVREELRIDDWLRTLVAQGQKINRQIFRRFVQHLNRRVRELDTSELGQQELFLIYDAVWNDTLKEVGCGG